MLKIHFNWTHNNITFRNGFCYKFKYLNYEHDPYPHIFFLYAIRGTNPSSGNKWDLIQAINLNYLPRAVRKKFVADWGDTLKRSKGDFKMMWKTLMLKYPYMKIATRRYLLTPKNYINNIEYIAPEQMDKEIVRNMVRDYSMAELRRRGRLVRQFKPKGRK